MKPTRLRPNFFGFPSAVSMFDAPGKPCSVRRRVSLGPMVQSSVPSTGFTVSSRSLP